MEYMQNFLKKLFNKTFIFLVIVMCAALMFFFRGWVKKQGDKCIGMYYVYKGDKAYRHSNLQKAIDDYNEGLQFYPGHYGAWFNLGNIYVVYEDYEAAADAYEHAIKYNKNFTLAKMNLGIILAEKLGDFDESIDEYNSIINSKKHLWSIPFVFSNKKSEKTNKGLAYYNRGVAYRKKSLYQDGDEGRSAEYLREAIESYKNAVKILKDDYDSYFNLALAYHLDGDYQNAGLNYCKSIELRPMNYEVHYNMAILLRHLKKYKEAYSELEKATILVTTTNKNPNTTSYVFSMLNQVSNAIVANDQYSYFVERLDNLPYSKNITYINGKLVATDDLDRAMLKNFKTCETKDFFKNYQ